MMNCLRNCVKEWKILNQQSISGYGFCFLDRFYWLLVYCIMGYFGKGNLGAIIIALSVYNLCTLVLEGILVNLVLFLKSCKGDKKQERFWISIASLMVVGFVCLSIGVFLLFNFLFYYSLGLNNNVKTKAIEFSWLLFPSFLFDGFQKLFQIVLLHRNQVKVVMIALTAGIIANIVGNIFFVIVLGWGPPGSAFSISLSKCVIFMILGMYFRILLNINEVNENPMKYIFKSCIALCIHGKAIIPVDSSVELSHKDHVEEDVLDTSDSNEHEIEKGQLLNDGSNSDVNKIKEKKIQNILKFLAISSSTVLMVVVDSYPYELLALIVANLGNVPLSTNQMLIILAQFFVISFIFPLSGTTSNRIFYFLADNCISEAKYTAMLSFTQTILTASIVGLLYYFFWENLGYVFTSNQDIVNRTSSLMFVSTFFVFVYSLQIIFQGILRGLGYQLELFGLNFLSMWLLSVPLGLYFCYFAAPTYGLEGLWFGLLLGSSLQCFIMAIVILSLSWKRASRKIKYYRDFTSNSSHLFYPYEDVILPIHGSRSIGGFFISLKTIEDELLELEAIDLEGNVNT